MISRENDNHILLPRVLWCTTNIVFFKFIIAERRLCCDNYFTASADRNLSAAFENDEDILPVTYLKKEKKDQKCSSLVILIWLCNDNCHGTMWGITEGKNKTKQKK